MRILVTAVFERVVYHSTCLDPSDPARPVLEVDALLREGDADGPLLLPAASYKQMLGFERAAPLLADFRAAGRTTVIDGVEYLTFPVWRKVGDPLTD